MDEKETSELRNGSVVERSRRVEIGLRIVSFGLCIPALVLMVKSKEVNEYGTLYYHYIGAFRYLAYVNGICAGYSVLSAVVSALPMSLSLTGEWIVFIFDQVFTYLLLVAGSVATEVLYLARMGDEKITWFEVCSYYGKFCNRVGASVILNFMVCLCFVVLSIISAHRVFSSYDPPYLYEEDRQMNSQS